MNKNLDHLDPANWFPFYHMDPDRRAVPATYFTDNDDDSVDGYLYLPEQEEQFLDPWRLLSGCDVLMTPQEAGDVVLEFGVSSERIVRADHLVYIRERDFRRFPARAEASLKQAYDRLWKAVEVGALARVEFDERANFLREMRGYYNALLRPTETPVEL